MTEAREVFEALATVYTWMTYEQFCEALDFNPSFDQAYFIDMHEGISKLLRLDRDRLSRLVEWGQERNHHDEQKGL